MASKLLIKEIALGILIIFILTCFTPGISGHFENISDDSFDLNNQYIQPAINDNVADIEDTDTQDDTFDLNSPHTESVTNKNMVDLDEFVPGDPFDLNSPYIQSVINESVVDIEYIYNITKALSYIIFTEYDESAGEIAKGRAFGTKGEWRAADILYENMTKLGLYTKKEKIENLPKLNCKPPAVPVFKLPPSSAQNTPPGI